LPSQSLARFALVGAMLLSRSTLSATFSVTIGDTPPLPNGVKFCQFAEDAKRLEIRDGSKQLTKYDFCASYGQATGTVITDAVGKSYLLLRYAEGRGTNATTDYLAIFTVQPELFEFVRTPISSGAGPLSRWEYTYSIARPTRGGLRLTFRLKVERPNNSAEADYAPFERERTIEVNTRGS